MAGEQLENSEHQRYTKLRAPLFAFLVGLLFVPTMLLAQPAATPPKGEANEPTKPTDGALKTTKADPQDSGTSDKPKNKNNGKSEVFVPTEEISEDFAVSFPVDI